MVVYSVVRTEYLWEHCSCLFLISYSSSVGCGARHAQVQIFALPLNGLYEVGWVTPPLCISLELSQVQEHRFRLLGYQALVMPQTGCWVLLWVTQEDGLKSSPGSWHVRGWGQFPWGVLNVVGTKHRNAASLMVKLFLGPAISFSGSPVCVPLSSHPHSPPLSICLLSSSYLDLGPQCIWKAAG